MFQNARKTWPWGFQSGSDGGIIPAASVAPRARRFPSRELRIAYLGTGAQKLVIALQRDVMNAVKRGVVRKSTRTGMILCPIPTVTLFVEARTARIQHISGGRMDRDHNAHGHAVKDI